MFVVISTDVKTKTTIQFLKICINIFREREEGRRERDRERERERKKC